MKLTEDDHHSSHHGSNESMSINPEFACPAPDTGSNVTVVAQVPKIILLIHLKMAVLL
jgi:hypothetical protein